MNMNVRETFELAHKVLQCCIDSMETFGAFCHRVRYAEDYGDTFPRAVPHACHSPLDLWNQWQRLVREADSLDMLYFRFSETDITRALNDRPVTLPAILNVEATTHVEALCLIADRIRGAIKGVCSGSLLPKSFEAADEDPRVIENCEFAAARVSNYAHNDTLASDALSYLRRAVFAEEESCRRYFNPDCPVAAPKGKPGRKPDELKTRHALKANEFKCETPQPTWGEVAHRVNKEFLLDGPDRYDDYKKDPENPIRELWRLRHGDKFKKKIRD